VERDSNTCQASCCSSDEADGRHDVLLIASVAGLVGASWLLHWLEVDPGLLSVLIAVAAAATGLYRLATSALASLLQRRITVDLLVTIAVIAALLYGEYRAAGMVAFIMLLGEHLERRASRRSRRAIAALLELAPQIAVVRRNGAEVRVPAQQVQPGEVVVVRPGERIPVDGATRSAVMRCSPALSSRRALST
jgi:Cd2+/Zn2+-exporting ATPase